eukprot:3330602-Rhodomonas_salina.1
MHDLEPKTTNVASTSVHPTQQCSQPYLRHAGLCLVVVHLPVRAPAAVVRTSPRTVVAPAVEVVDAVGIDVAVALSKVARQPGAGPGPGACRRRPVQTTPRAGSHQGRASGSYIHENDRGQTQHQLYLRQASLCLIVVHLPVRAPAAVVRPSPRAVVAPAPQIVDAVGIDVAVALVNMTRQSGAVAALLVARAQVRVRSIANLSHERTVLLQKTKDHTQDKQAEGAQPAAR